MQIEAESLPVVPTGRVPVGFIVETGGGNDLEPLSAPPHGYRRCKPHRRWMMFTDYDRKDRHPNEGRRRGSAENQLSKTARTLTARSCLENGF